MKKETILKWIWGIIAFVLMYAILHVCFRMGLPKSISGPLTLSLGGVAYLVVRTKSYQPLTVLLLLYVAIVGFLGDAPRLPVLNETIRNLHFHVTMWFAMIILLLVSVIYSIQYLKNGEINKDIKAKEFAYVGTLFGVLGIVTGSIWAKSTWGHFWSGDPKQNAAAIGLLAYFGYIVLRMAFIDDVQRAKISAIYNVFSFPILVVLLFILPRLAQDSLHPGVGGNPAFSSYDLSDNLRMVFYPAIFAWTLLGVWLAVLKIKLQIIEYKKHDLI